MIYLDSFSFPTEDMEIDYLSGCGKFKRTCYDTKYPFGMFSGRELPEEITFSDITIFCGNNGSGKSTILNVIAERLGIKRDSPFNRSEFFDDYASICKYTLEERISPDSRVLTSDDVFEKVLDIRRINDGVDSKRSAVIDEWVELRSESADTKLHGIDDYERWKKVRAARDKNISQSQYIRSRLMRNVTERSNGESALALFVDAIRDNALYILDEPENSLSPGNQLELKYFLEDSVRHHGCQFIISTHSPFLLSLKGAKIYDIDSVPVKTSEWTELPCVRVYKEFFDENSYKFCQIKTDTARY